MVGCKHDLSPTLFPIGNQENKRWGTSPQQAGKLDWCAGARIVSGGADDYENQKGCNGMKLVAKKRISTLKQYRELENKIKDGFKCLILWVILMMVAGNSYLN